MASTPAASKSVVLAAAAVLVASIAIAYHAAPRNGFHFDDYPNVVDRGAIRMDHPSVEAFGRVLREAALPRRPLSNLTLAVDWWRGGGEPEAFQWTNLAIHTLTALAVFALLLTTLRRTSRLKGRALVWIACGAATLWAVHPIQVQTVTYVVQRMAALSALFTVLSVIFYVKGRGAGRRPWIWFGLASVSFLMAMASKENAAIAPFLLFLAEYGVVRHGKLLIQRRMDAVIVAIPVVLLALAVLDVTFRAGPLSDYVLPTYGRRDFTLGERLLTQPRVVAFHLSQLVWPLPGRFSIEHDFPLSTSPWTPWTTAPALLGVLAWCVGGIWAFLRRESRVVGFWMLWVPATLAIESSVIALEIIFEHRMYLPTVGMAGLLAVLMSRMAERFRLRTVFLSLAPAVSLLIVCTAVRVPTWRTPRTLSEQTVRAAPNSARAWADLGSALLLEGRVAEAEDAFRRALTLDPDEERALERLGVIEMDRGRLVQARSFLERAMEVGTRRHDLLNHLAEAYLQEGESERALGLFEEAVARAPWIAEYRWNLALAHERLGQCDPARAAWEEYLRLEKVEAERQRVLSHLRATFDSPTGACAEAVLPESVGSRL